MSTSAGQDQSGRWFDVTVLISFIVIGLGGLASIFFSSSQGLASTQFVISFVGLLISIGLVKRWKQMFQGKLEILLRIVTAMLLASIIVLQSLILIIGPQRTSTSPQGQPGAANVQPTPNPSPTPTSTPTPTPTPTPPKVEITFPTEGSKVGISIIAQGTASNIPQGENLWLLVNVSGINGYYPQDGPITVLSDGTWNASVAIGGLNDAGRPFVLLAALADQEGEATLEQYIKLGHASGLFPAIPLPKGVQVISLVHVVRQ